MDVSKLTEEQFCERLCSHISRVYQKHEVETTARKLVERFSDLRPASAQQHSGHSNISWDEQDVYLIAYGDSIHSKPARPLRVLYEFLMKYMKGVVNTVHILPFFPYSSDDGFAVINYTKVNRDLGDWDDIKSIADEFKLMADLVINHVSSQSDWFQQYLNGEKPGCNYFIEADAGDDIAKVVRPRHSPLLQEVNTSQGKKLVWCTFSFDQVDLDFANPEVLLNFADILRFYLEKGIRVIRLDAIAFLWKKIGTSCINLPQTHEIIKIFRLLTERYFPDTVFVTETNIPNLENLEYFGDSNETHIIYNFSLPPLLLHALWVGSSEYLTGWSMSLPPAPSGCTYLNFTASHDGIGLRPVEGMLPDGEIDSLVTGMQQFGGEVTTRAITSAGERPYEINISWFEAMKGTVKGIDAYQAERFLCTQVVMLGLEGIPAFYINSLFAAENDYEMLALTRHKRSINRKRWDLEKLEPQLFDNKAISSRIYCELKRLISIKSKQQAFHPNATQYTLHLGPKIFGFWRQSRCRDQSVFAIHNLTDSTQEMPLDNINLISTDNWVDLIALGTLDLSQDRLQLCPYQCLWITNKV